MESDGSKKITKRELALLLGITVSGVDKLMARRTIPYFKISRKIVRFDWRRVQAALDRLEIRESSRR